MASILNPLTFPLNQHALIEASAGTGKTWTIAALYVRAIVEKNCNPQEILVLTFTNAATAELKNRIRLRLIEAALAFEGKGTDDFLNSLIQQHPLETHSECALKLRLAAQVMDEAAIFTIHAWCKHILQNGALLAGIPFEVDFIDESQKKHLEYEIICAYWRMFYTHLTSNEIQLIFNFWETPQELHSKIQNLLNNKTLIHFNFENKKILNPQQIILNYQNHYQKIQQEIIQNQNILEDFKSFLKNAKENDFFDNRKLNKTVFPKCLNLIDSLKDGNADVLFEKTFEEKLYKNSLKHIFKENNEILENIPALNLFEKWKEELNNNEVNFKKEIYLHVFHYLNQKINKNYQEENQQDFDSLLIECHNALKSNPQMIHYLQKKFPYALIDEFQDTDPIQCSIFEMIYPLNQNKNTLILIGDPKQAIYSFRGADVYSYLNIRQKLKEHIYTLKTNYRAIPEIIETTNLLFDNAEKNLNQGAFGFKKENTNNLPFESVYFSKNNENKHLKQNHKNIPALKCFYFEEENNKDKDKKNIQEILAENCAHYLAQLLKQKTYFDENKKTFMPKDCAILVNSANEAQIIKGALQQYNIPSAYLSEKESVYKQKIAQELYFVLDAILNRTERKINTALLTQILNADYAQIQAIQNDEDLLENTFNQFQNYALIWQKNGIETLIHKLLFDFNTITQCSQRVLTDIRHLAELLQIQSNQFNSQQDLLNYFNFKINHEDSQSNSSDEQIMRLETDENIVPIITIHKSKGLEYPFVIIPFLNKQQKNNHSYPLRFHNQQNQLTFCWNENDEIINQKIKQEEILEDIRKIYVALTRAKYALCLGIYLPIQKDTQKKSAFDYLITPFKKENLKLTLQNWCENLNQKYPQSAFAEEAQTELKHFTLQQDLITNKTNKIDENKILSIKNYKNDYYFIDSFSRLTHSLHQNYFFQTENNFIDENENDENNKNKEFTFIQQFKKGAEFGNQIHKIFEDLIKNKNAIFDSEKNDFIFEKEENKIYKNWFKMLCENKLPIQENIALKDLNPQCVQSEMEFHFPVPKINLNQLEFIIQNFILPSQPRLKINQSLLNGMLNGKIDLIFSVQNCFYIVDYKTNFLGENIQDYNQENIHQCFLENRYDLQMTIYLIALHRFLKNRLPNYSPEKNIGGAIYYFLRGVENPNTRGFFVFNQVAPFLKQIDQFFT